MSSESQKLERQSTVPFLLRLFYRSGSFHRPDEFSGTLPPHVHIYTWQSCSLRELSTLLVSALPDILPSPSVGTRLCFRLIYPDTQGSKHGPGRYLTKELGSVVIGTSLNSDEKSSSAMSSLEGDAEKTLQDARFVIGDYVSCAVLPPLSNGEVAAPPSRGPRPDFASRGPPPGRENGFGSGSYGGPRRGGRFDQGRGGSNVPPGEWRRGDVPPGGGGTYGRGRGRSRGW